MNGNSAEQDNHENFWELNDVEVTSSDEIDIKEMETHKWEDIEADDVKEHCEDVINTVQDTLDLRNIFDDDTENFTMENMRNEEQIGYSDSTDPGVKMINNLVDEKLKDASNKEQQGIIDFFGSVERVSDDFSKNEFVIENTDTKIECFNVNKQKDLLGDFDHNLKEKSTNEKEFIIDDLKTSEKLYNDSYNLETNKDFVSDVFNTDNSGEYTCPLFTDEQHENSIELLNILANISENSSKGENNIIIKVEKENDLITETCTNGNLEQNITGNKLYNINNLIINETEKIRGDNKLDLTNFHTINTSLEEIDPEIPKKINIKVEENLFNQSDVCCINETINLNKLTEAKGLETIENDNVFIKEADLFVGESIHNIFEDGVKDGNDFFDSLFKDSNVNTKDNFNNESDILDEAKSFQLLNLLQEESFDQKKILNPLVKDENGKEKQNLNDYKSKQDEVIKNTNIENSVKENVFTTEKSHSENEDSNSLYNIDDLSGNVKNDQEIKLDVNKNNDFTEYEENNLNVTNNDIINVDSAKDDDLYQENTDIVKQNHFIFIDEQKVTFDEEAFDNIWDSETTNFDLFKIKDQKSIVEEIKLSSELVVKESADKINLHDGTINNEFNLNLISSNQINVIEKIKDLENKGNAVDFVDLNKNIPTVIESVSDVTNDNVKKHSNLLIPEPNIAQNKARKSEFVSKTTHKKSSICILRCKIIFSIPVDQKSFDVKSKEIVHQYKSIFKLYDSGEKTLLNNIKVHNEEEMKITKLLKMNERDIMDLIDKKIGLFSDNELSKPINSLSLEVDLLSSIVDSKEHTLNECIKRENWFLALLLSANNSLKYTETLSLMLKKYFRNEKFTFMAIVLNQYTLALDNLYDIDNYWFDYFRLAMKEYNKEFIDALIEKIFYYSQLNALYCFIIVKLIHNDDLNVELFKRNIFAIDILFILDTILNISTIGKLKESYLDFIFSFDKEESHKYFVKNKTGMSKEYVHHYENCFKERKWKFGGLRKVMDKSIGKIIGFDFERKGENKVLETKDKIHVDQNDSIKDLQNPSDIKNTLNGKENNYTSKIDAMVENTMKDNENIPSNKQSDKNTSEIITGTDDLHVIVKENKICEGEFYQQRKYAQSVANISSQNCEDKPEKVISQDDTNVLINSYLKDEEDDIVTKKEDTKEEKTGFFSRLFSSKKKVVHKAKQESDASFKYDPVTKKWINSNSKQSPIYAKSTVVKEKTLPKKVNVGANPQEKRSTVQGRYSGGAKCVPTTSVDIAIPGVKKTKTEN